MDKRLQKRHKRQVARAKIGCGCPEPDVRSPEREEGSAGSEPPCGRPAERFRRALLHAGGAESRRPNIGE